MFNKISFGNFGNIISENYDYENLPSILYGDDTVENLKTIFTF